MQYAIRKRGKPKIGVRLASLAEKALSWATYMYLYLYLTAVQPHMEGRMGKIAPAKAMRSAACRVTSVFFNAERTNDRRKETLKRCQAPYCRARRSNPQEGTTGELGLGLRPSSVAYVTLCRLSECSEISNTRQNDGSCNEDECYEVQSNQKKNSINSSHAAIVLLLHQ